MNMRPRCRPWLPLATQQLRLRNLVRIQGLNIECDGGGDEDEDDSGKALIYYTLHNTKEGAAIYRSEALPQRHMQQKWAELECAALLKSNSNCVCVKVWACFEVRAKLRAEPSQKKAGTESTQQQQVPRCERATGALPEQLTGKSNLSPNTPSHDRQANDDNGNDRLLFTWAVYFSGLILLGQPPQTDASWPCPNSLIFQLNGDYFAAPEHFTPQSLRAQLAFNYQRYSTSIPPRDSASTNLTTPQLPDNNDEFAINSPQVSRSSSPAAPLECADLLRMAKARYTQLKCTPTDVRPSYNLMRLLQVQRLQRLHLQKLRETADIAADIRQRCVRCITPAEQQQLSGRKQRTLSSSSSVSSSSSALHHHSMGRALSVLLAEQHELDPATMLRTQQLQRQLETLRCRQRLLQTERDTYAARNAQRRCQLHALTTARTSAEAELHAQLTHLHADQTTTLNVQELAQLQSRWRIVVQQLEHRMSALCMELREIYPIGRLGTPGAIGLFTICGIALPNMEAYVNDAKYAHSIALADVSPLALSCALGYVAHLVQMIAVVNNRPMRNPILHEGSRTRIMDIIKEIPYASREFPLYTRSSIPSKQVKYAIYLLNQNIAQLCYDITGTRCDLRATIENLLRIFSALGEIEQNLRGGDGVGLAAMSMPQPNNRFALQHNSSRNSGNGSTTSNGIDTIVDNNRADCLSKSHSSIDMNHEVPVPSTMASTTPTKMISSSLLPSSQPLPIAIASSRSATQQQRICRSVGSYSDCEDEDLKYTIDQCYSNSDSNITFQSGHV